MAESCEIYFDVSGVTHIFYFGRDKLGHVVYYDFSRDPKVPDKSSHNCVFNLYVELLFDLFCEVVNDQHYVFLFGFSFRQESDYVHPPLHKVLWGSDKDQIFKRMPTCPLAIGLGQVGF